MIYRGVAERVLEQRRKDAEHRRKERRMRSWNLGLRMATLLIVGGSLGLNLYMFYLRSHNLTPNTQVSGPQAYDNTKDDHGMPQVLNINGERWIVMQVRQFSGPSENAAAATSCNMHVIWFLPSDTPSALRWSLMHEVIHAGACLHGGDKWWNSDNPDMYNHDGIYHLADFLTNFNRANPEFVEWTLRDK